MYKIASILNLLCLIHGVVLGLILIQISSKQKPSAMLGVFLLFFGLSFTSNVLNDYGISPQNPFLIFLPFRFYFLIFPLLFLYIKKMTVGASYLNEKKHLYPGLLEFCLLICVFVLVPGEDQFQLQNSLYYAGYMLSANLFGLWYLYKSWTLIQHHTIRIKNFHSSIERRLLNWLKPLLIVYLLITFCDFVLTIIQQGLKWDLEHIRNPLMIIYVIQCITYVVLTYWLAFYGVKQYYIYNSEYSENENLNEFVVKEEEDFTEFEGIFNLICKLLDETKCYTNEDLTIVELATLTKVHYRKLSKVINYQANCNFNTFINKYRVEEAKKIMKENNRLGGLTLDVVGQEAGFKSRSSFYSAFKKFENKTPASFIKK